MIQNYFCVNQLFHVFNQICWNGFCRTGDVIASKLLSFKKYDNSFIWSRKQREYIYKSLNIYMKTAKNNKNCIKSKLATNCKCYLTFIFYEKRDRKHVSYLKLFFFLSSFSLCLQKINQRFGKIIAITNISSNLSQ